MRKLLQLLIAVLLTFGVKSQTFTPIHNYQAPDGLEVVKHLGIPYGTDTSTYTLPDSVSIGGISKKSAPIFFQTSDSTLYIHWGYWLKCGTGSKIDINSILSNYYTQSQIDSINILNGFSNQDGLVSGGIVSWVSGLTFDVSASVFKKFGVLYYTRDTTITLDPADANYSRIDLFAIDTTNNGEVIKITGIPSPIPVAPQVSDYQIALTTGINLNVGDTVPSNVSIQKIYDENIEWATSTDRATVDFNNTTFPYTGSKDAFVSSYANIGRLVFTRSGNGVIDGSEVLKLHISLNSPLRSKKLYIAFFHGAGSTLSSNIIGISSNNGLDPNKINQYQTIVIPASYFQWSDYSYNRIILYVSDYDTSFIVPFYLDDMELQTGINNIPQQTDYSKKVDSVVNRNDSLFYVINKNYYWTGYKGNGSGVDSSAYINLVQAPDSLSGGIVDRKGRKSNIVVFADGLIGESGSGIQSVTGNIVDNTDPLNPIVNGATIDQVHDTADAIRNSINPTYQWSVLDSLSVPPTSPLQGDIYLVGTSPSGSFSGHSNQIATYDTTAGFAFQMASLGDLLYNSTTYYVSKWNGTLWIRQPQPLTVNWWSSTNSRGNSGNFIKVGNRDLGTLNLGRVGLGLNVFYDNPNVGSGGSIAIGEASQYHNRSSSHDNISLGNYSLWYFVNGHDNIALGAQSLSSGTFNYATGLGFGAKGFDRTFSLSDSTKHMYFNLDSAAGAAPSVIGKDANGFWHTYQTPTGGSGGGSYQLPYNGNATDYLGGDTAYHALPAYTASNGLTMVGSDMQLGGTLSKKDTINTTTYNLSLIGSPGNFEPVIYAKNNTSSRKAIVGENSGSDIAVYGTNTGDGSGIGGYSSLGNGVSGSSVSAAAGHFVSNTGNAIEGFVDYPNVNSVIGLTTFVIGGGLTPGTEQDGLGGSYNTVINNGRLTNSSDTTLRIISKWSSVATRTSEYELWTMNDSSLTKKMSISGDGLITITKGVINLGTQFTPANSTDNTFPNKTLSTDDTYLYYRKSNGTWVKIPWVTF